MFSNIPQALKQLNRLENEQRKKRDYLLEVTDTLTFNSKLERTYMGKSRYQNREHVVVIVDEGSKSDWIGTGVQILTLNKSDFLEGAELSPLAHRKIASISANVRVIVINYFSNRRLETLLSETLKSVSRPSTSEGLITVNKFQVIEYARFCLP